MRHKYLPQGASRFAGRFCVWDVPQVLAALMRASDTSRMTIRRCSDCAQLVHFEARRDILRCWNCGRACHARAEYFLWPRLRAFASRALLLDRLSCERAVGWGRVALAAAFPIAVLMLLISNSLDVRLVDNIISPFLRR